MRDKDLIKIRAHSIAGTAILTVLIVPNWTIFALDYPYHKSPTENNPNIYDKPDHDRDNDSCMKHRGPQSTKPATMA